MYKLVGAIPDPFCQPLVEVEEVSFASENA